jgi:predicted AAA+ superfamily ATPase
MNERIRNELVISNPWWKTGHVDIAFKHRNMLEEIKKYQPLRQIIAFTGLRRVGKTTLLKKILSEYIVQGKHVVFFSFDDFWDVEISAILEEYSLLFEEEIGNQVVFFDEIQKVKNWQEKVKRIYDTYPRLKIYVSGSESLNLASHAKESLAGRVFTFSVDLLTFPEFLEFKEVKIGNLDVFKGDIIRRLREYSKTGGFPELVDIADGEIQVKYMKELVLEKIIYRDIPRLFPVENPSHLQAVVNILIGNPGQLVDLEGMSREIGISRQSLAKYISYLENAFVISKLYNYSRNESVSEKRLKKFYPAIPALSLHLSEDAQKESKFVENLIVQAVHAKYFWRSPQKDEVDIVLKGKSILPIEVKQREKKEEYLGLKKFMDLYGLKKGLVITKDNEFTEKIDGREITRVPAWKFLLRQKKYVE